MKRAPGKRPIWRAVLALGVLGMGTGSVWAADQSVGAIFLNEAVGPRPAAMGEAFTAAAEDINALAYNPGGLCRSAGTDLLFAHTFFLQGFEDEYLAFNWPLSKQDALGINAFFSYTGQMEKTTLDSADVSTFGASDAYLGLTYSRNLGKGYAAGVTLKGLREAIDTYSGQSAAVDVGVLAQDWLPNLNLGLTVRNLGFPLKLLAQGYALPAEAVAGGAYRFFNRSFLWTLDLEVPFQQAVQVKSGWECNINDLIFLRAGYRFAPGGNDLGALAGLTAGVGLVIADYSIDYAYVPYGVLGDVHRISVTFPFGRNSVDEEKVIRRLEKDIRTRQENIIRDEIKAGVKLLEKKDYLAALPRFEKALALNPQYPGLKEKLARARAGLNQVEADKHFHQGMKAFGQNDFVAALVEWNKVLEIAPQTKDLANWIAQANRKLSQPVKAETGLHTNPKVEQAVAEGLDWLRKGQYHKAIEAWQGALRYEPGNEHVKGLIQKARNRQQAEISENLAAARDEWENENWVEAVRAWRQVLKIDPENIQALQDLETNQMKIRQVANDLYMLGVNNYVENKLTEAIENLKDLLVLDPDNQKAKKHLESVKRKIEEIQTIQ
jgi:tetratricopeptide (TPR) repeat protein